MRYVIVLWSFDNMKSIKIIIYNMVYSICESIFVYYTKNNNENILVDKCNDVMCYIESNI